MSQGTRAGGFRYTTLVKQLGPRVTAGRAGAAYARGPPSPVTSKDACPTRTRREPRFSLRFGSELRRRVGEEGLQPRTLPLWRFASPLTFLRQDRWV